MDVIDVKIRDRRATARFRGEPRAFQPNDLCLVEIDNDKELARVKSESYTWENEFPPENDVFILQTANDDDIETARNNRIVEREAFTVALEKIRTRELPMALTAVERTIDGRKMRFFFTADNRIDFRELVKDLAYVYKTRIEMRQIGVRDRAKKIGGFGICGQELCCSRFLQKFAPITIRMAKEQNLALNPTKISGLCGRLMCCLSYEVDDYNSAKRLFPRPGTLVSTSHGKGSTVSMNFVKNTVHVNLDEGKIVECKLDDLTIVGKK